MNLSRTIAFLLVLLEAATLGYMAGTWLFPISVATVAAIGVFGRFRLDPAPKQMKRFLAVLVFAFVLKSLFQSNPLPWVSILISYQLGYDVALFLLIIQSAQLYLSPRQSRWRFAPAAGILVMVLAGNRMAFAHDWHAVYFGFSSIVFTILLSLYSGSLSRDASSVRRSHPFMRLVVLSSSFVLVAALTLVLKTAAINLEDDVIRFAINLLYPGRSLTSVGWSETATLESVRIQKSRTDDRIVIRAFTKDYPGYLRGLAYDSYKNRRWVPSTQEERREPLVDIPDSVVPPSGSENVFQISAPGGGNLAGTEIWRDGSLGDRLFLPYGTSFLSMESDRLLVDSLENVRTPRTGRAESCLAYVGGSTSSGPGFDAPQETLVIPEGLESEVLILAKRLFQDLESTGDKVRAVRNYLDNYEYSLQIEVPEERDPLSYFLLSKPPAHCEYFAAGTVALLRLGGVPCRYVTGFVPSEKNSYGGYWVAASGDAHAWAEVHDPDRGWTVVDTTPAEGIPSVRQSRSASSFLEYAWFSVARSAGSALGWCRETMGRAPEMVAYAKSTFGTVVAGIAAICGLVWIALRVRRGMGRVLRRAGEEDSLSTLHDLLGTMDRKLLKQGLQRGETETIEQFAGRILHEWGEPTSGERAAAWYRDYACVRYGTGSRAVLAEDLRRRMPSI